MKSSSGQHVALGVEAMATLSEYLELALDRGGHLIMVKSQSSGNCTLYVGDETMSDEDLPKCGAIQSNLADAILESALLPPLFEPCAHDNRSIRAGPLPPR